MVLILKKKRRELSFDQKMKESSRKLDWGGRKSRVSENSGKRGAKNLSRGLCLWYSRMRWKGIEIQGNVVGFSCSLGPTRYLPWSPTLSNYSFLFLFLFFSFLWGKIQKLFQLATKTSLNYRPRDTLSQISNITFLLSLFC